MENRGSTVNVIVIALLIGLCCCLVVAMLCFGGIAFSSYFAGQGSGLSSESLSTATPIVIRPTDQTLSGSASGDLDPLPAQPGQADLEPRPTEKFSPPSNESQPQPNYVSADTLATLENTIVPINDPLDLSARLKGILNIPATVEPPAVPYQVGDRETFWVANVDTDENFQIQAVLGYATAHAYFWIEEGVSYDENDLQALAETFETKIYPTNRAFFGSEWSPGVDGDEHLYIIFADDLGFSLAGYFSSADEYHPDAQEYSNAHETFMLNADNVGLDEGFTYGVLAHEHQHMIHWYQDRNESSWLNEGFSELAAFLNGYDAGGFDYLYSSNPDLQLNDWPNDPNATSPHYGAAFLFVTYFLDRFGESVTQALVGHPANGMASVDAVLMDQGITDPQSGQPIRADNVFIDWAITNYLLDEDVADGRFTYQNYIYAPRVYETETIRSCGDNTFTRDVRQYGVDYIRINCDGETTLYFEGSIQTGVLPVDAYSGSYAFWSNKGDESDMTLTRTFDFTTHEGLLTLTYWTWYDLEENYDYLYLEASTDGQNWEILETPSGTTDDPSGNSYGWGYNGLSGGDGRWVQEQVDLSGFAGQEVFIRFEYVTDAAVNGEGLLLDDIAIPEIGYFDDFERDSGGWEAAGFVRIQNILPQTYQLALISIGDHTTVEYITLTPDNTAEIPLSLGGDVDEVILVVAGTTRYTRQPAAYRFEFMQ
jgi:hypothetical protein